MFVDIYTHLLPDSYFDRFVSAAPHLGNIGDRMKGLPPVHSVDARLKTMDGIDDYRQIISLPNPPLENVTTPEIGTELARQANDAMAETVARHGDRFPAFVAAVAMHDMDGAMTELHRAIGDLGAAGVQIFTDVAGRPLDDPAFRPLFAAMADYGLPIWLHPARTAEVADYPGEERSRHEIWWMFGWPYDTTIAMSRLVLDGLFDRHPDLNIITHHCGGMVPFYVGRLEYWLRTFGVRTSEDDIAGTTRALKRPAEEYFRMFYGDTAMFGEVTGTKCGLDYFGADHVVFATDAPFASIPDALAMLPRLGLGADALDLVACGNAERLTNRSYR